MQCNKVCKELRSLRSLPPHGERFFAFIITVKTDAVQQGAQRTALATLAPTPSPFAFIIEDGCSATRCVKNCARYARSHPLSICTPICFAGKHWTIAGNTDLIHGLMTCPWLLFLKSLFICFQFASGVFNWMDTERKCGCSLVSTGIASKFSADDVLTWSKQGY